MARKTNPTNTIFTTSGGAGTVLTTVSGATIGTINSNTWLSTGTNTTYVPNIGNQFVYNSPPPSPFNISFSWEGRDVSISLKNGNDIFKLANAFMEWLDTNEIEYNVKTKGKRKKK